MAQDLEARLEVRRMEAAKLYNECENLLVDDKGLTEDNLTAGERRGLKDLQKRVKDGEIIICQTDKSGRLAVLSRSQYIESGNKHLKDTTEVNLRFAETNQSVLNGHISWWAEILNIGEFWNQEDVSPQEENIPIGWSAQNLRLPM